MRIVILEDCEELRNALVLYLSSERPNVIVTAYAHPRDFFLRDKKNVDLIISDYCFGD